MSYAGKPEMVVSGDNEFETFDDALRNGGKYAGTAEDEREMRALGKSQVLNVSLAKRDRVIGV